MGDRLVFEADGRLFGFQTTEIHKIIETQRLYFMPGQAHPVSGVVTLSGLPITVLDIFGLLQVASPESSNSVNEENSFHRVIVLKDGKKILGFDIGSTEISFALESVEDEEPDDKTQKRELSPHLDQKLIELKSRDIEEIDWRPYFDVAAEILSSH